MRTPAHFSALARRAGEPPISWLMKLKLDRPGLISLAAGFTDDQTLPVPEVSALTQALFRKRALARLSLQYGSTIGLPALRQQLIRRWQRQDQIARCPTHITPDHMVITNGSQQLLYLVSEVLCDPGDIVLVEDPTYFVYLGIVEALGIRATGFASLHQLKIKLQQLKTQRLLPRLKMLYLVTYHCNPTGVTWSLEAKREALAIVAHYERAAGHPIYVIEDAAYRDLRFEGDDVPSFKTLDLRNERVIYANTLTKPFATGLKIGCGILPSPILGAVLRSKGNHDFGTANFLQTLMAHALAEGVYDRHVPKINAVYRRKRDVLLHELNTLPKSVGARCNTPHGGLYVWLQLPEHVHTGVRTALFRRALDAGVLYVPGELCYCTDPSRPIPRHFMRLSFGAPTIAQIRRGIQLLMASFGRRN